MLEDFSIVKSGERRVESGAGAGSTRRHGCGKTINWKAMKHVEVKHRFDLVSTDCRYIFLRSLATSARAWEASTLMISMFFQKLPKMSRRR